MVRPTDATGGNLRLQVAVAMLTKVLVTAVVVLTITSLAGQSIARAFGLNPHGSIFFAFDMNNEFNIPTAFETLLFLGCALTLAVIAAMKYLARDRWAGYWAILSCVFLGLAWDEATVVHERLITPVRAMLDLSGIFYFAWIVPAFIVVALFGMLYLRFLIALPTDTRRWLIVAAMMFFSAVFVLEALSGWYFEQQAGNPDMTFELISTLEELLEMSALIVLLHTLLTYLISTLPVHGFKVNGSDGRIWVEVQGSISPLTHEEPATPRADAEWALTGPPRRDPFSRTTHT